MLDPKSSPPLSVGRYMKAPVVTVAVDAPLDEARRVFETHGISSVVVMGPGDELVGVVSRTDLLRLADTRDSDPVLVDLEDARVMDVMTRSLVSTSPETAAHKAAAQMVAQHIHRLYVLAEGRVVGVFGTRDAMQALVDARVSGPLDAYMSAPVLAIQYDETVGAAIERFRETHVSGLVVQEGEWPVGLFTQREALEARVVSPATPVEQVMSPALLCLQHDTPIHRAAALALATRARRVLALQGRHVVGLSTGLDFCRALRDAAPDASA
jgi:CBS domain-containing protein